MPVGVLKILCLAMPMYMSTFYQDFPQLNFQQGGPVPPRPPLRIAYGFIVNVLKYKTFLIKK